jgi:predicted protein tyrosine phosphatase
MSRAAAEEFVPPARAALVSIRDGNQAELKADGWALVLHLEFDDIDERCEGFKLFTMSQAKEVCDFVAKLQGCELLVAQCHYGVSRSGAVARFASRVMGAEFQGDAGGYNRLVFDMLARRWVLSLARSGRLAAAVMSWKVLKRAGI